MYKVTIGNTDKDNRACMDAISQSEGEFNINSSYICLGKIEDCYVIVDKNGKVCELHKDGVIDPCQVHKP